MKRKGTIVNRSRLRKHKKTRYFTFVLIWPIIWDWNQNKYHLPFSLWVLDAQKRTALFTFNIYLQMSDSVRRVAEQQRGILLALGLGIGAQMGAGRLGRDVRLRARAR